MNTALKPHTFVFFGPPGAGKGEQAKRLSKHFNIPHISSGALLREESKKQTELGRFLSELLKQGHFPPEEYIINMISTRVAQKDCEEGFILDGFPRTLNQAKTLDQKLSDTHELVFINISIDETSLIERLCGRRICSHCDRTYHVRFMPPEKEGSCDCCSNPLTIRSDDYEHVIKERLKIFNEQFNPMKTYYLNHKNWFDIPSVGSPEDCFNSLFRELDQKLNTLVKH